jgi:hypothetical protein
MLVYVHRVNRVENPRTKIAVFTHILLFLLIILSILNAIFLGSGHHVWLTVIVALNLICMILSIGILLVLCIVSIRLINLVEDLSKRKFINAIVFIFCFVQIILFTFFAFILELRGYESRFFIVSALLIFLTFACRIIIIGSIFMFFAIFINMCYTCLKCTDAMIDRASNPS